MTFDYPYNEAKEIYVKLPYIGVKVRQERTQRLVAFDPIPGVSLMISSN